MAQEPKTEADERKEKDQDDAHIVDKMKTCAPLDRRRRHKKNARQLTKGTWSIADTEWAPAGTD